MYMEAGSALARRRFKQAYRALRIQGRFLTELDELIDRYRTLSLTDVPWDKIYTSTCDLYWHKVTPLAQQAAFYAFTHSAKENHRLIRHRKKQSFRPRRRHQVPDAD
jgi:hypothetical protein